jgi:hypothetical protein
MPRWLAFVALMTILITVITAARGVHRPRFQGQGRPPGQGTGGQSHGRGSRQFSPAT